MLHKRAASINEQPTSEARLLGTNWAAKSLLDAILDDDVHHLTAYSNPGSSDGDAAYRFMVDIGGVSASRMKSLFA